MMFSKRWLYPDLSIRADPGCAGGIGSYCEYG
jgi:hypothetical protein